MRTVLDFLEAALFIGVFVVPTWGFARWDDQRRARRLRREGRAQRIATLEREIEEMDSA